MARKLIKLIDGQRTLRKICQAVAAYYNVSFDAIKDTVLKHFRRLIDEMNLAMPEVARFHNCPRRSQQAAT